MDNVRLANPDKCVSRDGVVSFRTVFSVPVLGTLQRTEASWLCLNVHGWTSWK